MDYASRCIGLRYGSHFGNPNKVMRLMRDMVDDERANPREVKYDQAIDEPKHSEFIETPEEEVDVDDEEYIEAVLY